MKKSKVVEAVNWVAGIHQADADDFELGPCFDDTMDEAINEGFVREIFAGETVGIELTKSGLKVAGMYL